MCVRVHMYVHVYVLRCASVCMQGMYLVCTATIACMARVYSYLPSVCMRWRVVAVSGWWMPSIDLAERTGGLGTWPDG